MDKNDTVIIDDVLQSSNIEQYKEALDFEKSTKSIDHFCKILKDSVFLISS